MSVGVSGKFLFAIRPLLCAVFVPLHPAVAQSLRGLRYEDPKTGFRIPRDYSQIPVQQDESWIVAMFQSKKAFTGSVKDGDSGFGRKPMLKVILFDQDAIARSSTVELQGGSTITTDRGVPYRDYRDYAKRNLTASGYYFEMEEQDTIKKVPVTKYEIKIDKSTRDRMRYIAWVFHGDGYDIALEIDLLEAQYRRQRNLIFSSFKSLEKMDKDKGRGEAPAPASPGGGPGQLLGVPRSGFRNGRRGQGQVDDTWGR